MLKGVISMPKQKRAIQTREDIIETAVKVFSEKGYYNTSTNEISKVAGVSIGCFYSHFKDKKELLIECMTHYFDQIFKAIYYPDISPTDSKEKIITCMIKTVFHSHQFLADFHREISSMCLTDEDVKKIVLQWDQVSRKKTYEILSEWKSQIKVSDLNIAAYIVYNLVENIVHTSVFMETEYSEEQLTKELVTLISNYLFSG